MTSLMGYYQNSCHFSTSPTDSLRAPVCGVTGFSSRTHQISGTTTTTRPKLALPVNPAKRWMLDVTQSKMPAIQFATSEGHSRPFRNNKSASLNLTHAQLRVRG